MKRNYKDMLRLKQELNIIDRILPLGLTEMPDVDPQQDMIESLLDEIHQSVKIKDKKIIEQTKSNLIDNLQKHP